MNAYFVIVLINFKLKDGIPTDKRFVDEYLSNRSKEYNLLSQWLDDFRSRFSDFEEAVPTILEVESALQVYKDTIWASVNKILVQKARDARKAEGAVLE